MQDASKRGFGNSTSPAPNKKRQKEVQRPFQEPSSSRQQPPPSAAATLEGYVIGLLTLLFIVFILEGIFLAISVSTTLAYNWPALCRHWYV